MCDSVLSLLDDAARYGDRPAFRRRRGLRSDPWSFDRLRAAAFRCARALEARGVGRSDRVLLRGGNSPEWIAAFFGCLLRGAVAVPLDEGSRPELVTRVQEKVRAKVSFEGAGAQAAQPGGLDRLPLEGLEATLAEHAGTPYAAPAPSRDDLVEIVFTSGTTSDPKGVAISHRNILANLVPIEGEIGRLPRWTRLLRPVRLLSPLPLSHLFGQYLGLFVPMVLGAEVVFADSAKPIALMDTIRAEGIAILAGVPRQLEAMQAALERDARVRGRLGAFRETLQAAEGWSFARRVWAFRDIHRRLGLRFWLLVSGGAALAPATEVFWRRLGFVVVQGYGLTEAASLVSANHPLRVAPGTIGKTLPGQEVRIGPDGEILIRGENVSPGYWECGGLAPLTDAEGWLHTGDIAERDSQGALVFRDRGKDVIVTAAGQNVYPADLERALAAQPGVAACTVFALEGPRGPEPAAALVLSSRGADPGAVVQRANETLAPYQRLQHFMVWPEPDFPRTPATGKVRKRQVAEAMARERGGAAPVSDRRGPLADVIASVSGVEPERLEPGLDLTTDLKLDSLGRVELLSALEDRYQVELDESSIGAVTTVRDVHRLLQSVGANGAEGSPPAREAARIYPEWALGRPAAWVRRALMYGLVLPVTGLLSWPRGLGRDRLPQGTQPVLFAANHVTMVDHVLILAALPARFRHRLAIAMEGERLWAWRDPPRVLPVLARVAYRILYIFATAAFNVFPLPKQSGFRRSFAYAGRAVDRGYSLLVFPEGLRTPDGKLQPFMVGIGRLAADLALPVVPVRISGLFELAVRSRVFSPPGRVRVAFGSPASYASHETPAAITADLERRVAALGACCRDFTGPG